MHNFASFRVLNGTEEEKEEEEEEEEEEERKEEKSTMRWTRAEEGEGEGGLVFCCFLFFSLVFFSSHIFYFFKFVCNSKNKCACVRVCRCYMIETFPVFSTPISLSASSTSFQGRRRDSGGRKRIGRRTRTRTNVLTQNRKSPPPAKASFEEKEEERIRKMNQKGQSIASEMVLKKPKDISEADFANYFCTYGYLYHQKDMLEDQDRMTAYYNAVKMNPSQFEDKVVLDVGTGSGILAIWAAQAGAKHVYAVEATFMATHARKLIEANGLKDKITVIQSSIEDAELPEKVDVIISEWMGYFLLRESMFDSVIIARDKWMKPGGAMYPSHATMSLSLIKSHKALQKIQEMQQSLQVWDEFVETTKENYGVDMSVLTSEYEAEQEDFFMNTSAWVDIHPSQELCAPFVLKEFDLNTATLDDIEKISCEFKMKMLGGGMQQQDAAAFAGWFDVKFAGSKENPAENVVPLTTSPNANGSTHWGQQAFYVHPEISSSNGNIVRGTLQMVRKKTNKRLMEVKISWEQAKEGNDGHSKTTVAQKAKMWHIE